MIVIIPPVLVPQMLQQIPMSHFQPVAAFLIKVVVVRQGQDIVGKVRELLEGLNVRKLVGAGTHGKAAHVGKRINKHPGVGRQLS